MGWLCVTTHWTDVHFSLQRDQVWNSLSCAVPVGFWKQIFLKQYISCHPGQALPTGAENSQVTVYYTLSANHMGCFSYWFYAKTSLVMKQRQNQANSLQVPQCFGYAPHCSQTQQKKWVRLRTVPRSPPRCTSAGSAFLPYQTDTDWIRHPGRVGHTLYHTHVWHAHWYFLSCVPWHSS